jgi:ribonuclease E
MSKIMLIDAVHSEETRVALIDQNKRLIEYDFESSTKQTCKGNIYLAKIMRVEPSLQAAFVDYGGNRHGFLAFSEIHPDYFRIPVSDREALSAQLYDSALSNKEEDESFDQTQVTAEKEEVTIDTNDGSETIEYDNSVLTIAGESIEPIEEYDTHGISRPPLHKMYKIQEVIHKNQILLVQVTKEERGQKGAALTTYLSLAGRYCVLMPNSPHAGGISRKISHLKDRKRLRETISSLQVPKEMGLIIRTAGKERTRAEIRRDTEYLLNLWNEIREETLKSIAPKLIYQEDSIIKRAVRDLYSKDIAEVIVEGDEGYKAAKDFMKKLMAGHVKRVVHYKGSSPIFIAYQIERQIEQMHSPVVHLPSGGSIVINHTEALVAVDINSGRATRERHIEETALNTNLEAAEEIARQVRLRDLAGLIIIDFIDMDDRRHVNQVERKIREAFRDDRARVQMSKVSPFGLLELSRQRLRPSILETSSSPCPYCKATGYIRSTESMSLQILRTFEEEGISGRSSVIKAQVPPQVGIYLSNEKRRHIVDIENRYQMSILIEFDESIMIPDYRVIQLSRRTPVQHEEVSSAREVPDSQPIAKETPKQSRSRRRRKQHPEKQHQTKANGAKIQTPDQQEQKQQDQKKRRHHRRHRHRSRPKKTESTENSDSPAFTAVPVIEDVKPALEVVEKNNAEQPSVPKKQRQRKNWLKRLLE